MLGELTFVSPTGKGRLERCEYRVYFHEKTCELPD